MTLFMAAYLTAMSSAGFLGGRFGLRKVLLVGAPLQGITVALLLVAQSPIAIFICLIAFGIFAGLVDLIMNAEGARVERDLGRPLLAHLRIGRLGLVDFGLLLGRQSSRLAAAAHRDTAGAAQFRNLDQIRHLRKLLCHTRRQLRRFRRVAA